MIRNGPVDSSLILESYGRLMKQYIKDNRKR